jgi:hypothetical protein
MYKDSLYNKMLQSTENRLNTGFDYTSNGMLKRFLSPTMTGNPRLKEFIERIDKTFIELANTVKKVQFYLNYTIDKNDNRINQ